MNTLILNTKEIIKNDQDSSFFIDNHIYCGMLHKLKINLKKDTNFNFNNYEKQYIFLTGRFNNKTKPFRLEFDEAEFQEYNLSEFKNWTHDIIIELLKYEVPISICLNSNSETYIYSELENHYLNFEISNDSKTLILSSFGRYVPVSSIEDVRRGTNWTKGIFTNIADDNYVNFTQTSWMGEEFEKCNMEFTSNNSNKLKSFIKIPLLRGWLEKDYYLGESPYKASGKLNNPKSKEHSFTLLDIGEQDIPLLFDKVDQYIRRWWGDSWINNKKRSIIETLVEPIK